MPGAGVSRKDPADVRGALRSRQPTRRAPPRASPSLSQTGGPAFSWEAAPRPRPPPHPTGVLCSTSPAKPSRRRRRGTPQWRAAGSSPMRSLQNRRVFSLRQARRIWRLPLPPSARRSEDGGWPGWMVAASLLSVRLLQACDRSGPLLFPWSSGAS